MTLELSDADRRVRIAEAAVADLPVLANLYQFYRYDLAATRGAAGYDLLPEGRYAVPPYLATIGADPRTTAFLVWADGALAGFALVRASSQLTDDPAVTDLLDFFVARKYRGLGVGRAVARSLFDRYPGRWEVRAHRLNGAAQHFWRRVVADYTGGWFTEVAWDDARHRGLVLRFTSARHPGITDHAP